MWVWVAGLLALSQAGMMVLFAWEQRRYLRSRHRSPQSSIPWPPVRLIVPCRGVDPQMEQNLRALFELDYPALEIVFVVESLHDSAAVVINDLRPQYLVPCRLLAAGIAQDCGQKVHNLIAASEQPFGDREVLAFVDSDARPSVGWLKALVHRLVSSKSQVVTGYRWYAPVAGSWPGRLVSAVNNIIVGLLSSHGFNLAWGGAWAIRREAFAELGLPTAWRGSLSDDLIVSRLIKRHRLRLSYEPRALVNSPAVFTWASACEFLRRQFTIVRHNAPKWWHLGFWSGLVSQCLFWGFLFAPFVSYCVDRVSTTFDRFESLPGVNSSGQFDSIQSYSSWQAVCLTLAATTYLLGVVRWYWSLSATRPFVVGHEREYRIVALCNMFAWPLVSLTIWLAIASTAVGKTLTWRGITYRMDGPNHTVILHRVESPTTDLPTIPLQQPTRPLPESNVSPPRAA